MKNSDLGIDSNTNLRNGYCSKHKKIYLGIDESTIENGGKTEENRVNIYIYIYFIYGNGIFYKGIVQISEG
jgi:hypothetical protein